MVRITVLIEKNVDYTELLEEIALKELKYIKYNCLKMIGKENDKKIYVITNDHTHVLPICAETDDDKKFSKALASLQRYFLFTRIKLRAGAAT